MNSYHFPPVHLWLNERTWYIGAIALTLLAGAGLEYYLRLRRLTSKALTEQGRQLLSLNWRWHWPRYTSPLRAFEASYKGANSEIGRCQVWFLYRGGMLVMGAKEGPSIVDANCGQDQKLLTSEELDDMEQPGSAAGIPWGLVILSAAVVLAVALMLWLG